MNLKNEKEREGREGRWERQGGEEGERERGGGRGRGKETSHVVPRNTENASKTLI